jgi:hypothetical protein
MFATLSVGEDKNCCLEAPENCVALMLLYTLQWAGASGEYW